LIVPHLVTFIPMRATSITLYINQLVHSQAACIVETLSDASQVLRRLPVIVMDDATEHIPTTNLSICTINGALLALGHFDIGGESRIGAILRKLSGSSDKFSILFVTTL